LFVCLRADGSNLTGIIRLLATGSLVRIGARGRRELRQATSFLVRHHRARKHGHQPEKHTQSKKPAKRISHDYLLVREDMVRMSRAPVVELDAVPDIAGPLVTIPRAGEAHLPARDDVAEPVEVEGEDAPRPGSGGGVVRPRGGSGR
jgi:hypothetical protein